MDKNYEWTLLCEEKVKEINQNSNLPGTYKIEEYHTTYYFTLLYIEEGQETKQLFPGSYEPEELYTALIAFEKGLEIGKKPGFI